MKIAIVSDSMSAFGGAERVIEQILAIYPSADLFAVVDLVPPDHRGFLEGRPVRTSFLQKLPGINKYYRYLLQLWPLAIEQFDLSRYDVVISSHHSVAYGALTRPDQLHVSYVHSPMRYAWDLQNEYLEQTSLDWGALSLIARHGLHRMRIWDYVAAQRPDDLVANSHYVAERLRKLHRRDAKVIHPPVSVAPLLSQGAARDDYYVTVGRLVPYKRVDLLVNAFRTMPHRRLKVIGTGPEYRRIAALAGPNVELLGHLPTPEVQAIVASARAFLFAGIEDFGIASVEAQAVGTPVIAYAAGGLRETVVTLPHPRPTGLLFREQSVESLVTAINNFEAMPDLFRTSDLHANAAQFSVKRFRESFRLFVEDAINRKHAGVPLVPARSPLPGIGLASPAA